jgi:hypothetical protein
MMGQQQQKVTGNAQRRMFLVLAVAALMAAMMAVMAAPAFARSGGGHFVTIHGGPMTGVSLAERASPVRAGTGVVPFLAATDLFLLVRKNSLYSKSRGLVAPALTMPSSFREDLF